MTEQKRFIDNGNDTITDTQINVMWKKQDSFQELKKWRNWFKSQEYVEIINIQKFAGYSDWRLPTGDEAWALFDLAKTSKDKYGDDIYLDPIFPAGSAGTTWTSDTKDSSSLVIQFEDGVKVWPSQYANMSMGVRLVRTLSD